MTRRRTGGADHGRIAVILLVALACNAAALAASPAYAHVPEIESSAPSDAPSSRVNAFPSAQLIHSPTISRAVYGFLAPGQEFDAFHFTVEAPVTTTLHLLVPVRSDYKGFEPTISVFRAGSREELKGTKGSGKVEYEPFSIVSFREIQTAELDLRPRQTYYVIVRPGSGPDAGPYVLAFSGAESFTRREVAQTMLALPIIWSGAWAGAPIRPVAYGCCGSLLAVAAAATALVVLRRRRSRPPTTFES